MPTLSAKPGLATTETHSSAAVRERPWLSLFDPLRILASISVVWVHVRAEMAFGVGFGLFLFLMMMYGLAACGSDGEATGMFARRKARALLVPWLRWSAFYLLLYAAVDAVVLGRVPSQRLHWQMIAYGGSRHLWFLPYAMGALLLVRWGHKLLAGAPARATVPVLAVLGMLGAGLVETVIAARQMPLMAQHWLTGVPALPLGLAFGQVRRLDAERARQPALATLVAVSWAAYALSPASGGGLDVVLRYTVATTLAAAGFAWRPHVPGLVTRLSTLTFGVYLAHPLWLDVFGRVPGIEELPAVVHVGLVWSAAALTVWVLRFLPVSWPELRRPAAARVGTDVPDPLRQGREQPVA